MAENKEFEYTEFEKMENAAQRDGFEAAFEIGTPVPSKRGPAFQWQVVTQNELDQGGELVMKMKDEEDRIWSLTLWSKDLRFMLRIQEPEDGEEWAKVNDGHGLAELKAALNETSAGGR